MRRELSDLVSKLVAIDSVNPELIPGARGEVELARFVAAWLERAGLDVEVEDAAPGRPNVVAVARGTGGGRSLLLNAHLDTVGVAGMERPHDPYVENGRLYGRGAYDMKGSLAAIMLVAAEAARRGLAGDVLVAAVADEEVESVGAQAVARRRRVDAVIVAEPTELRVAVCHRGFVAFEAETRGRAAHGSRPDLGIDAIAKMGRVLVGLEELDRTLRAGPQHPLLGTGSLHASVIEGGQEYSSYPARCLLKAERRTLPGETPELLLAEVGEVVRRGAEGDPDFHCDVRVGLARDPFQVDAEASIVQAVRRHAARVLASEPPLVGVPFWTDAGIFSGAGMPTVVFGPAGEGAHAVVEWIDLESLAACAEIYLAVAEEVCS
ncbi:MAG: M20/M25/M40 family metallo-hydrolase [Actinomycetota bacterium]|nr:M20/M25/M40 family metallo-hydrolase [Actinomycetota bacterium]